MGLHFRNRKKQVTTSLIEYYFFFQIWVFLAKKGPLNIHPFSRLVKIFYRVQALDLIHFGLPLFQITWGQKLTILDYLYQNIVNGLTSLNNSARRTRINNNQDLEILEQVVCCKNLYLIPIVIRLFSNESSSKYSTVVRNEYLVQEKNNCSVPPLFLQSKPS